MMNRAPILGGSFALWAACYSSIDCSLIYMRKKEDALNSVVSGFLTGYILAFKGGMKFALKNGIIGGILLGMLEGMQTINTSMIHRQANTIQEDMANRYEKSLRLKNINPSNLSDIKLPYFNNDEYKQSISRAFINN